MTTMMRLQLMLVRSARKGWKAVMVLVVTVMVAVIVVGADSGGEISDDCPTASHLHTVYSYH